MSIRIISTPLFGSDVDTSSLATALRVARRFEGHLAALFVSIDPSDTIPVVGEGISPAIIEQLTQAAEAEMARQRAVAKGHFETACRTADVAIVAQPPAPGTASAHWSEVVGRRDEMIPQKARASDLVVLSRAESAQTPELGPVLEATVLGGGRPILLAPPAPPASVGHTVAIAWNGTAEAARAVAAAMPFVEAAESVRLLTAETWRTELDVTLDLVEYLAWRGIACERQAVQAEGEPVGAALLRTAGAAGADLFVMGGYGRSRLSELVLGGVTRHVLAHADLPVLMTH